MSEHDGLPGSPYPENTVPKSTQFPDDGPPASFHAVELSLFRSEALESRRYRLEGDVIISFSAWLTYGTLAVLAVVLTSIFFLARAEVPRIQQVSGWLTTTKGLVQIQATRVGTVTDVKVQEGVFVKPQDVLLTIRTEQLQTELGSTPERSLLSSISEEDNRLLDEIDIAYRQSEEDRKKTTAMLAAQSAAFTAVQEEILHQRKVVSLAEKTSGAMTRLAQQGAMAKSTAWTNEITWAQSAQELASFQRDLADLAMQIAISKNALEKGPIDRDARVADIQAQRAALHQKYAETQQLRSYTITAPIAGHVTSLVARPGYPADGKHPLMAIVPSAANLVVELFVPSSARAFIRPKQKVRVLLDAFPYQLFGSQTGTVTRISASAITPVDVLAPFDLKEPIYLVYVALDKDYVEAFGGKTPLQPGMTLKADIVLEPRSIFEWVFEPIYAVRGRM